MEGNARFRRRPLLAWTIAAFFAAWTAVVMYCYFAQFSTYFAAVWRRLPW